MDSFSSFPHLTLAPHSSLLLMFLFCAVQTAALMSFTPFNIHSHADARSSQAPPGGILLTKERAVWCRIKSRNRGFRWFIRGGGGRVLLRLECDNTRCHTRRSPIDALLLSAIRILLYGPPFASHGSLQLDAAGYGCFPSTRRSEINGAKGRSPYLVDR